MKLRLAVVALLCALPSRAFAKEGTRSYAAPVVIVDAAFATAFTASEFTIAREPTRVAAPMPGVSPMAWATRDGGVLGVAGAF